MDISINFNMSWVLFLLQNVLKIRNCCGYKISSMRFFILILYSTLWLTEGNKKSQNILWVFADFVLNFFITANWNNLIINWKVENSFKREEILLSVKVPFEFMINHSNNIISFFFAQTDHDHATNSSISNLSFT